MRSFTRRDALKTMAAAVAAPALARPGMAASALPPLPTLPASDALLLRPGDAGFSQYQIAYNKRTALQPQLRAVCKTRKGVATLVKWSRDNNLPFALRGGGHSYEGLSQSSSVAIDMSKMNAVQFDSAAQTVTVGSGAALGDIYKMVAPANYGFPGGSCPTVGVGGHVPGGGYGFITRRFGLACDSLLWAELVDANGNVVETDAQQNPDLFWALRGGGGGSFGAVTQMRFKVYPIDHIVRMRAKWTVPQAQAVKVIQAWQTWAPHAPATVTSVVGISRAGAGMVSLSCSCQSTGTLTEAQHEFAKLTSVLTPSQVTITQMTYWQAVNLAAGGTAGWQYEQIFQKAKSDYVRTPMSATGIATLLGEILKSPPCGAILDAYGGAISNLADDATAFGHRSGMLYSIQYFINWSTTAGGVTATQRIRDLYAAMRPHVSGAAYVNYCDTDLPDYATAYWGANLPRLKQIKAAVDPANVFRHAQSVPLP